MTQQTHPENPKLWILHHVWALTVPLKGSSPFVVPSPSIVPRNSLYISWWLEIYDPLIRNYDIPIMYDIDYFAWWLQWYTHILYTYHTYSSQIISIHQYHNLHQYTIHQRHPRGLYRWLMMVTNPIPKIKHFPNIPKCSHLCGKLLHPPWSQRVVLIISQGWFFFCNHDIQPPFTNH